MEEERQISIIKDLCTACGSCIDACEEGAIQLVDGVARVDMARCTINSGCSAPCVDDCPLGGVLVTREGEAEAPPCAEAGQTSLAPPDVKAALTLSAEGMQSLELVEPGDDVFEGSELLLMADCAPLSMCSVQDEETLENSVAMVGCPLLGDSTEQRRRLTDILFLSNIKSVTVANLDQPCCQNFRRMALEAVATSGRDLFFSSHVVNSNQARPQAPYKTCAECSEEL